MDKFLRDAIDIIFNKTSPHKVMEQILDINNIDFLDDFMAGFSVNMKVHYPFVSSDEMECLMVYLKKYFGDDECRIFDLIKDFAGEALIEQGGVPVVKFDEALRFRNTAHYISPEIFISSFLAAKDSEYSYENRKFDYRTSPNTDNVRLHNMLKKGIAENHFHIKGSTPAFMLSWVCLMNNITNRRETFKKAAFEKNPLGAIDNNFYNRESTWYSLVIKACYIRLFLFSKLNGIEFFDNEFDKVLKGDDLLCEFLVNKLQIEIDSYKKANNSTFDYAIPESALDNEEYRIFTGERCFLYLMFRAIYEKNPKIIEYAKLFYLYLLISIKLRGELIQINKRVGFANFDNYQDRKSIFIEKYPEFNDALISFALNSNLSLKHLKSIEARFVPKNDRKGLKEQIEYYDKLANNKYGYKKRLFYVAHFPKQTDAPVKTLSTSCRHQKFREQLEKQALAIANLREDQYPASYRLFGIDACANEIGCRPEVFAQVFRFLKAHQVSVKKSYNKLSELPPQLRITFHAGEDFLDIADGLRYISEAVKFTGMSYGDRIGHGLALGVEPAEWYRLKRNRVILPRQDLLDNAAWMMGKLTEYGCSHMPIFNDLNKIYAENVLYIYQKNLPFTLKDVYIDLNSYLSFYSLRGDNPELYYECDNPDKYIENLKSGVSSYELNYNLYDRNIPEDGLLNEIRENNILAYKLMHNYHYNPKVKECGAEIKEHNISDQYIEAVSLIQKRMRFEIAEIGIGIECNPSSNILIGTFEKYENHPIVKFNDTFLSNSEDNPRMFVSINTDDLGVFDTSLENEYALIACALQKAKDKSGKRLYKPDYVYKYLDNIREMSVEQSFIQA